MRLIAFTGPKTCGKDTAAKGLFDLNTAHPPKFVRAQFASGVKDICHDFFGWSREDMEDPIFKETPIQYYPGGPTKEPRWAMMDIANWMRDEYGAGIHAYRLERRLMEQLADYQAAVVTDLRFPDEELPMLRKYDSFVIYIEREEAEAKLNAAKAAGDAKALNASEAHYARLRKEADIIIPNNEEIYKLRNAVVTAVHNRFGHWSSWHLTSYHDKPLP